MIHFRIDIFGWRRANELFEENCRKDAKIRELKTGQHFQQVQLKGYGKEFAAMLKAQEELKAKLEALGEDRDEWVRKYKASEDARKSLGDKLVDAARERDRLQSALDLLRAPMREAPHPSASPTPSPQGEGEEKRNAGPYGETRERIATAPAAPRNDGDGGDTSSALRAPSPQGEGLRGGAEA